MTSNRRQTAESRRQEWPEMQSGAVYEKASIDFTVERRRLRSAACCRLPTACWVSSPRSAEPGPVPGVPPACTATRRLLSIDQVRRSGEYESPAPAWLIRDAGRLLARC